MRIAVLVLLAACSDRAIEMEDFEAHYGEARCERLVRCGVVEDVAACEQAVRPWRMDPSVIAAVRAGKARWNADVARGCLASLRNLGCDPTSEAARRPCFGTIEGLLGDGETCAFGAECISRECWTGDIPCTEACCFGTCVGNTPPVPGRIGDRCRHAPCAEGWCDGNLCVPLLPEHALCTFDTQCDYGLSCWGTCTALPGTREPCTYACRELGRVCLARAGNICTSAGLQDWPCDDSDDCSPFYTCTAGRCTLGRGAALSEPCQVYWECKDPQAHCDQGVCAPPKPDDEPCREDIACESFTCNGIGRCTSEACI